MAIPYTVSDVDISRVSESWTQSNRANFALSTMPIARCLDRFSGRSNLTSYNLADLSNALVPNELSEWTPGTDPAGPLALGETSASFTISIRGTRSIVRPLRQGGATFEHRLADLERNIVPIQLSKCYADIDRSIAAAMIGSSFQVQDWTGTNGEGLDTPGDFAQQSPLRDLDNLLTTLRPYQNFAGMELRMYLSGKVASVLSAHPDLTGAGTGSGVASGLSRADFAARIGDLLGVKVFIFDNLINSASYGQTATIVETFNESSASAVLFCGLFDTRSAEFDLTSEASMDAPDGALVLGQSFAPLVASHTDDRRAVQEFWGRHGSACYSPRGTGAGPASDLGFFMRGVATAGKVGIFKT